MGKITSGHSLENRLTPEAHTTICSAYEDKIKNTLERPDNNTKKREQEVQAVHKRTDQFKDSCSEGLKSIGSAGNACLSGMGACMGSVWKSISGNKKNEVEEAFFKSEFASIKRQDELDRRYKQITQAPKLPEGSVHKFSVLSTETKALDFTRQSKDSCSASLKNAASTGNACLSAMGACMGSVWKSVSGNKKNEDVIF